MKKFFSKENFSGKGFAIAVCVCLLIVGGVGVYSYSKVADELNDKLISNNKLTDAADDDSGAAQANAEQTQIAKTEAATEQQTTAETEQTEKAAEAMEEVSDVPAVAYQAMVRPVNGEIIEEFSDGELVKSATLNVWKTHDGVDIAGNFGEKVKSMTSGTVTRVYEDQMLGACVVVDHGNGLEGYYCNLSKDIPVIEGQDVSAGTIIGTIGDTAESEIKEASHLHFALKKNGEWIDPIALISGEGS
ncbi:MAG: M23 family metallopeptidase [Oscillospiraceae bacterium]|nr:M23 family metallopeptidase [Oscillospiraceae bacterium]